jgi:hypothetical protein
MVASPEEPEEDGEPQGEDIDWDQITDSLGFPLGGMATLPSNQQIPGLPIGASTSIMAQPAPAPIGNLRSVAPTGNPPALAWDFTPDNIAGPSSTPLDNIAAPSQASFNWWVPTPLGQPGHSVLSANMEETPAQALTIVNNPAQRVDDTITDSAPLLLDVSAKRMR